MSGKVIAWPREGQHRSPTLPLEESDWQRQLLDTLQSAEWVVLASASQPRKMTYDEFLAWADEDTLAEWVDGEVIMTSPASNRHQQIGAFLAEVLGGFVRSRHLGKVIQPPFQIKLAHSGREPDLLFVAQEHLDRLKETYLDGPADLVVEIVSPESMARDRGEKFYEYAQGGVPEYWLIDPQTGWAEFYQLEQGHYLPVFSGAQGRYESAVLPGFWLRVEWLWQESLPSPLLALAEIAGLPPAVGRFIADMLRTGRTPEWLASRLADEGQNDGMTDFEGDGA